MTLGSDVATAMRKARKKKNSQVNSNIPSLSTTP